MTHHSTGKKAPESACGALLPILLQKRAWRGWSETDTQPTLMCNTPLPVGNKEATIRLCASSLQADALLHALTGSWSSYTLKRPIIHHPVVPPINSGAEAWYDNRNFIQLILSKTHTTVINLRCRSALKFHYRSGVYQKSFIASLHICHMKSKKLKVISLSRDIRKTLASGIIVANGQIFSITKKKKVIFFQIFFEITIMKNIFKKCKENFVIVHGQRRLNTVRKFKKYHLYFQLSHLLTRSNKDERYYALCLSVRLSIYPRFNFVYLLGFSCNL